MNDISTKSSLQSKPLRWQKGKAVQLLSAISTISSIPDHRCKITEHLVQNDL